MNDQTSQEERLRSQDWFDNPSEPDMTALYLERFLNYGLTREELQSGRPIIGIAQTGSDLVPCNRHHLALADQVRSGIRDAGGIPMEFPVHPLQETGRRPTAALDRNLAYLGLVEVLHGYPIDGVVLTTGCDKTTPACLMAAVTVNIPAIVLSGGPMLNGNYEGRKVGSGTVLWEARNKLATGQLDYEGCMRMVAAASPSIGHCNTMGTALSMNGIAEGLGMSLPGCAAIPAPYRERGQMAHATGTRAVELVRLGLRPLDILTRQAFENAIVLASALGASSNCPPHLIAIARHADIELSLNDWQTIGRRVPLLVNCQPAGEHLGEDFFRAGGIPAVMAELLKADLINGAALTVSGLTVENNLTNTETMDASVIRSVHEPLMQDAGFIVLGGSLFDEGIMKVSVISEAFRERHLSNPESSNAFEGSAIVFDGPEDYRNRIDDPNLGANENSILIIRYCGPVGYPGSAEVVNMHPPVKLMEAGIEELPTIGDGRQSGTSASPSILNVSPEAAVGGNLALVRDGDRIRINLETARADLLVGEEELERRRNQFEPMVVESQTPWQEIYRNNVGQLSAGGCLDFATCYIDVVSKKGPPRHSH